MPHYSIEFDDKFENTLNSLCESDCFQAKAVVIRDAVSTYKFFKDYLRLNPGTQISITNSDGSILKNVELP